jgi:molybdenum cofactor cytidylyltransferase/nicotine blue oxidoreductase
MYVGVVLAAGSGTRMGGPKAELDVGGYRLLDRAVDALLDGGCAVVVAVVREGVEAVRAIAVVNPDPDRGMRSSLVLGLSAAERFDDVEAIAVTLTDLPGVDAASVATILEAWLPTRIAIGRVGGRRVHPTVMAPAQWREALALAGPDEGARRYLAAHPDLLDEVDVAAEPDDLDTPEDLAAWRAAH